MARQHCCDAICVDGSEAAGSGERHGDDVGFGDAYAVGGGVDDLAVARVEGRVAAAVVGDQVARFEVVAGDGGARGQLALLWQLLIHEHQGVLHGAQGNSRAG